MFHVRQAASLSESPPKVESEGDDKLAACRTTGYISWIPCYYRVIIVTGWSPRWAVIKSSFLIRAKTMTSSASCAWLWSCLSIEANVLDCS